MSSASNSKRTVNAAINSGCQTRETESSTMSVKQIGKRRRRRQKRQRRRIQRQEERALLQTEQASKQASSTRGQTSCKRLATNYHRRYSEENEPESDVPDYIYESYNESLVDAYGWEKLHPKERWEQAQLGSFEEDHQIDRHEQAIPNPTNHSDEKETYYTPPTAGVNTAGKEEVDGLSRTQK